MGVLGSGFGVEVPKPKTALVDDIPEAVESAGLELFSRILVPPVNAFFNPTGLRLRVEGLGGSAEAPKVCERSFR